MTRKLKGIRRRGQKWYAFVRVHGHLYTKTFDLTTPIGTMQDWRDQQGQRGQYAQPSHAFSGAIAIYARDKIGALPTRKQRIAHLELWAQALGRDRATATITSDEIDRILQEWLMDGLANGTVRKRRTSLQSFFKRMNGKRGYNPVLGTYLPPETKAEARSLDYAVIERMLAQMPDRHSAKRGTLGAPSLSKVRARVIAYTGIPPKMLQEVQPWDLNLPAGTVRLGRRQKGGGVEARTLELSAEALAAFKDFHAVKAYGRFATSSLNCTIKRAFKAVGVDPRTVSLYWLRHSFLTQLYRATRDEATVARLGMHAEGSPMTARYTRGAHQEVDAAAVAAFSQSLVEQRRGALKVVAS